MGKVIGIDLGTTNSCVALFDSGEPQVVANAEGARTTPSIVGFASSGDKLVGQIAKRQAVTNPDQTVFAAKRLIGRKFDSDEVTSFSEIAPFAIEAAENGDARVCAGDRAYSAQEISAIVLAKMKETAGDFLGEPVTDAVRASAILGRGCSSLRRRRWRTRPRVTCRATRTWSSRCAAG